MAAGDVKRARRIAKLQGVAPVALPPTPQKTLPIEAGLAKKQRESLIAEAFTAPFVINSVDGMALERQLRALTDAKREELRALALENFWLFVILVLFPNVWKDHYTAALHKPICDALQRMEYAEELWFLIPREHRKSYIVTLAHKVWLILKDPNIRILLVGSQKDTVKQWSKLMRAIFTPGTPGFETFQEVFADYLFPEGYTPDVFEFFHPLRTMTLADPTFRATYLGRTGAGWRCDVLHFDDAVDRKNSRHPELSLKTMGQMMDLWPLVSKTSKYRFITGVGTRWAYHDAYSIIVGETTEGGESAEAKRKLEDSRGRDSVKLKVVVRHCLEHPTRLCSHCPPHIVKAFPHGDPDFEHGEPIAVPVITREMLEDELDKYRRDPERGESMWWHQYMNICKAPSQQKFKANWFFTSHMIGFPDAKLRVLVVDSADKDFQKPGTGDRMVAHFGDFDDFGRLLLRHSICSRAWTREQFLTNIKAACIGLQWWPHKVAKEKFGNDTFLTDIGRVFGAIGKACHLVPVQRPSSTDASYSKKLDYIVESLQAPLERAEVIFGRDFPRDVLQRIIHQALNLGQVSHEDELDALSLFFDPEVRLMAVNRAVLGPAEAFRPPDLDLYEPGGQVWENFVLPTDPNEPRTPEAAAIQRVLINVDELGLSQVHFDENPPQVGRLNIEFDPFGGTGG